MSIESKSGCDSGDGTASAWQFAVSDESDCVGPALATMAKLADNAFIGATHHLKLFRRRWYKVSEVGLGYKRHHIHDKSPQLLDALGNERNLFVIDSRYQYRIDLNGKAQLCRPLNTGKLVGNDQLAPLFTAISFAVIINMLVDKSGDLGINCIDGDSKAA